MQQPDKIAVLKSSALFSMLAQGELAAIAQVTHSIVYEPNSLILRSKTVPARILIIHNGEVAAFLDGDMRKRVTAPITLGATNILLDYPTCFNWRALTQTVSGLYIQRSHLLTIVHQCPHILGIFFGLQSELQHSQGLG